jgi:glycosyltransferase involved in cell wall biosynthesis
VWTSKWGRQNLLGRSLDYFSFYLAAGWRLLRLARAADIIVAMTDPPLLSLVAAPIAWLTGAKLVNWLQDIFPEVAEELKLGGRLGGVALRLTRRPRNWSLQAARTNIVVGKGMTARLADQGLSRGKIHVIENWCDGGVVSPLVGDDTFRGSWALSGRFVVAYAGNLGRAHDIDTIIEAMDGLHQQALASKSVAERITFLFIGGGAQRAKLEEEVLRRELKNVQMHPYQPRDSLPQVLGLADVHLVSLNPKMEGLIVPSKFYRIAAASRPTLFIGASNGDIARLIKEAGCGFIVAPGDGKDLMKRILQLARDPNLCACMGARGRAAYEQRWNKNRAIDEWREVLNAAAGSRLL